MALDLHTANARADWETVQPRDQNRWQRLAARTRGIVTPANVITLLGLLLTVAGMLFVVDGSYTAGIALVVFGRLADIIDGLAAAWTHTKSPLGELLDSSADKLAVAAVLVFGLLGELLPTAVILAMLCLNLINVIASLYSRRRGHILHPSREGKYAMGLSWVTVILFFASAATHNDTALFFANMTFWLYVLTGAWASWQYAAEAIRKK